MEKMSKTEIKNLRELQAKAKRVARAEAEFLKEADARKEELLKRWANAETDRNKDDEVEDESDTEF